MGSSKRGGGPVVVMAFQGWNDAADAATSVLDFLADTYPTEMVVSTDSEDFFDYQLTRPSTIVNEKGERELVWPCVSVELCHLPKREIMLVSGPEPNLHWREFAVWLESVTTAFRPSLIVLLGAMLSDSPHTRPFEVSGLAPHNLAGALQLEPNDYEGPTGIIGVMTQLYQTQCPDKLVTMWVSVPHYTAPAPNPKAGLALLERLQTTLGTPFDLTQWRDSVVAWESQINELVEEDPDMSEYVQALEQQTDSETVPQGTGDKLAEAFEEYLSHRRRPEAGA